MWLQTGHEEQWLKNQRQRMDQMTQGVTATRNTAGAVRHPAPFALGPALSGLAGRVRGALVNSIRRPALARLWSLF
jgi:hypothetical protein